MRVTKMALKKTCLAFFLYSMAAVCLAGVSVVPDSLKEKPLAQQENVPTNKDYSEKSEAAIEKKEADQSLLVPDESGAVITDHIDPQTGKKYQELHVKIKVKNIEYIRQTSIRKIFIVNGIYVTEKIGGDVDPSMTYGKVSWPEWFRQDDWQKLVGLEVEIYCRLGVKPSENYKADKYCSLRGKNKYFVRFH